MTFYATQLSLRFTIMHKRIIILFILALLPTWLPAQKMEQDALLWLGASLEKKFTKKASLLASPTIRLNRNVSSVENIFLDLGFLYKFKGPFSASANYRTGLNRNNELMFLWYHRYYFDVSFKEKIFDRIRVGLRARYQQQISAVQREEDWDDVRKTFRIRAKIEPKWNKRTTPYFSSELFYRFNAEDRGFNRLRLIAGAEYEIDKRKSLEFYYIMQRSIFQSGNDVDHIYGITFNWTL